jgi:FMN reductase (NADPH)
MNQVINTLLAHRSIRKFKDEKVTEEQISLIVKSAQAASTSSNIQAYSIIGISDEKTKETLAHLAGDQSYVANNGIFLVFCADLYRHEIIAQKEKVDFSTTLDSTEKFMVATIDASLAAQNAAIAAESLGLGVCYIGGLRNNLHEVSDLLNTPKRVVPLFGLAIGYPAHQPDVKPRLATTAVYHENRYNQSISKTEQDIANYDQKMTEYYESRNSNKRVDTWSKQIVKKLTTPTRMYIKKFLSDKHFPLK